MYNHCKQMKELSEKKLDARTAEAYGTAEANGIKEYTIHVRHIDNSVTLEYVHDTARPFNLSARSGTVRLYNRGSSTILVRVEF